MVTSMIDAMNDVQGDSDPVGAGMRSIVMLNNQIVELFLSGASILVKILSFVLPARQKYEIMKGQLSAMRSMQSSTL